MDPATLGLLSTLGASTPSVIFAVMWWLERTERKNLSEKLIKTLESMGAMNEAWLKILKGEGPQR